jgi:DNA-binding GntR family transcriptional regulator
MKETQLLQIQAYDYLIDMIKKGELQTDHIYSLNQMAQKMGISRTPLRDAVLRLEQERYVDLLPSKGFILHKMTAEDIVETYQLRNAIESYCFKQLSRNLDSERGQEYFNKLSKKVELQKDIVKTTYSNEDFARKDYEFHRSIVQYVGNESMLEIYRRFMYRIFWQNVTSFSHEGRMTDTIKEHQQLLEKIKAQDFTGLDCLIEHHLTIAQDINLELLDNQSAKRGLL